MNYTLLEGRLGKDPVIKTTPNGKMVATFSIGVSEKMGEREETAWINIVAWGKLAEKCDLLSKGSSVFVQGRISTRSYDNREGKKVYVTEVIANKLEPLTRTAKQPATADDFGEEVQY